MPLSMTKLYSRYSLRLDPFVITANRELAEPVDASQIAP